MKRSSKDMSSFRRRWIRAKFSWNSVSDSDWDFKCHGCKPVGIYLNFNSLCRTLGLKSRSRDFPAVHREMMYDIQLPNECRDFTELCADQVCLFDVRCFGLRLATSCTDHSTGNLMPRYLRRFTSMSQRELRWISMQANRSSRNSVVFCKNSDNCGDRATPGMPVRATSYSGRYFSSKKKHFTPSWCRR